MNATWRQTRLLLRNDLRLLWRSLPLGRRSVLRFALIALALLVAHTCWTLVASAVRQPSIGVEASAWAFVTFLMLGAAMHRAIALFFEISDLDLLLASPVDLRAVLVSRIVAIAAGAVLGTGILLLPIINGFAIGASAYYLFGYITWALLALIASSIGIWLTFLIVRWLGPRRARTWSQVAAAVAGASVYLLFQLQNMTRGSGRTVAFDSLFTFAERAGFHSPAAAARGEIIPLVTLAVLALAVTSLTGRLLARTFLSGWQEAVVRPSRTTRRYRRRRAFAGGLFRATIRKDLRLIVRDPLLLSQTLPSFLYILPAFIGLRHFGGFGLLAPIAVVLAAQFSSLLCDVAANGEEGLDLIRASPVNETRLRLAKLAAGMALPIACALVLCIILAFAGRPWLALLTAITAAAVGAGCGWLGVTRLSPSPRKDLLTSKRRRLSLGRNIAVGALIIVSSGGIALVAQGTLWFIGLPMVGASWLGVIACFTFAGIEPYEEDSVYSSCHYATAETS